MKPINRKKLAMAIEALQALPSTPSVEQLDSALAQVAYAIGYSRNDIRTMLNSIA